MAQGGALVTDSGIRAALEGLSGLKDLSLAGCSGLTPAALAGWEGATGLTSLSLAYCGAYAWAAAPPSRLPSLTCLNLAGGGGLTGLSGLSSMPSLAALNLARCDQLSDDSLKTVAGGLPSLTSLNIARCLLITSAGAAALGDAPSLVVLEIQGCRGIGDQGLLGLPTSLTSLNAAALPNVTDDGMAGLARLCRLEKLDITGLPLVTPPAASSALSALSRLRDLMARRLGPPALLLDATVLLQPHGTGLQVLSLGWGGSPVSGGAPGVSLLTALRSLALSAKDTAREEVLRSLEGSRHTLTDLHLHGLFSNSPSASAAALGRLSCLTSLQLSPACLDDRALEAALPSLPLLNRLRLSAALGLQGTSLAFLPRGLRDLAITGCPGLGRKGLAALASALGSGLTRLDLSSCRGITDSDLPCAAMEPLSGLTELLLGDCSSLGGERLGGLPCAGRLRRLILRKTRLGNTGASSIGRSMTRLADLDISGCYRTTDDAAGDIARLTNLTRLNVADCQWEGGGARLLSESLPGLHIIAS